MADKGTKCGKKTAADLKAVKPAAAQKVKGGESAKPKVTSKWGSSLGSGI